MWPIPIMYVSSPCTDPDWEGTATEQKKIHLVINLDFKTWYIYINSIYLLSIHLS